MRVDNRTPFAYGVKLTSRRPPQPELLMIVRARYQLRHDDVVALADDDSALSQGALTGPLFDDADCPERGECIYPDDFADYKPAGEVLLRGSCYAPSEGPVRGSTVRLAVGSWKKELSVFGDRRWERSGATERPGEPKPFSRQPLGYRRSYGGGDYARNPVGMGRAGTAVPNVEDPRMPLRSRHADLLPAGFGPLSPHWLLHKNKFGRRLDYQGAKSSAFLPADFDWSYFNMAPADQQLPGYFRGDETIALTNLHPKQPRFRTKLASLRLRVFVKRHDGVVVEAPLALDTLFIEPDDERITLTWRGVCEVREHDLTDVSCILICSEPLDSEPLPAEHYRQQLNEFERDPVGASVPEEMKASWKALCERAAEPDRSPPKTAEEAVVLGEGLLGDTLGADKRPLRDALAKLAEQLGVSPAAAAWSAQAGKPSAPPALPNMSAGASRPALPAELRTALATAQLAAGRARTGGAGAHMPVANAALIEQVLSGLRAGASSLTDRSVELVPACDASGQDLRGRDLRGVDLRNAVLRGANLASADLRGALLAGADLSEAVLYRADLADADLSDSKLIHANLSQANACGTNFTRALLTGTLLEEIHAAGADFSEISANQAIFAKARLGAARFGGSVMQQCWFDKAELAGASLHNAKLDRCHFISATMTHVDLGASQLDRCSFQAARLEGAHLVDAHGDQSVWLEADLTDVDARYAVLPNAHFGTAVLLRTKLQSADLRQAHFVRSTLTSTRLAGANLLAADFRSSQLDRVSFLGANLYRAVFVEAKLAHCDFTDAHTALCTLTALETV